MKGGGLLLFGVIAGTAAIYLANKSKAGGKLEFYPKNVKFTGKKLFETKAYFLLDVVNPTQTPIEINTVFANIYINDTIQLGRIEYTSKIIIRKAATTTIGIPIKLFSGGVAATLQKIILGKGVVCRITGTINTTGFNVPFENVIPFLDDIVK